MSEETGIYIFCAIGHEGEMDLGKVELEGEQRDIFLISYKDASMVAAEVPQKIYHPKRENLMMHQQVISRVMEQSDTVVPISFGNVFRSKEDVEALLENLYPQFETLFPAIKGKIEIGLKVIGKSEWLESVVKESPGVEKMSTSLKGKSESAGYYERIQLGGMAQKVFQNLQTEMKSEIFAPLQEAAESAKANDPSSERMLLNAAFLIDRDKEKEFDELVNKAHEAWKGKADFNYSGPWPAYNFVNIRLKVEEA